MIKDLLNYEGPIDQKFMIKSSSRSIASNGNPYYSFTLQDASGTLDAKQFNNVELYDIDLLTPGTIVKVSGLMTSFRGHPQIKIQDLEIIDEKEVDVSKLIPTAPRNKEELIKELNSYIEQIKDKELQKLTKTVIDENYEKYTTYPAAVTIHHAYYCGLLFHSLSICKNAIELAKEYKLLNKDYLIVGSLLHDIGKTVEFSSAVNPEYTTEGNLLGHINIGYDIVSSVGLKLKIDQEKLNNVLHIILSHHGLPEYGSSKIPQTIEAHIIHVLDDLDAKMNLYESYLTSTPEGEFTPKMIPLNIQIYKAKKTGD